MLQRTLQENEFGLRLSSKTGDKCDFAQKYLFNAHQSEVQDFGSQYSEDEDEDDECYSQASVEEHEASPAGETQLSKRPCQDMIFSCFDWENAREPAAASISGSASKRTAKVASKEAENDACQFDIDSIMQIESKSCKKRLFSQVPIEALESSSNPSKILKREPDTPRGCPPSCGSLFFSQEDDLLSNWIECKIMKTHNNNIKWKKQKKAKRKNRVSLPISYTFMFSD